MKADQPEIAGLMKPLIVVEKQADIVGRVVALRLDLLVREEDDLRIGVARPLSFNLPPE